MLLGTVLELLGIGVVVPLFIVISNPEVLNKYSFIVRFLELIGSPNHGLVIIYTMLLVLMIYVIKVSFLTFSTFKQSKFIYNFSSSLSTRLFSLYIRQPYAFHLNRNSAELIRNVITDVVVAGSVIQSSIIILTELFILISMFLFLLVIEPIGITVSIGLVTFIAWLYQLLTKKHVVGWGREHHHHAEKRFQFVQEGLAAAKDVKLLGREKSFIEQFDFHNFKMSSLNEKQYTLSQLPRLFLELFAILGLVLVVISMVVFDRNLSAILPILALIAASAFRLMPSINRVLANSHTVQYGLSSIETLDQEFTSLVDTATPVVRDTYTFNSEILIENVSFKYENSEKIVINNINFSIKKGESFGIIGGSGAGKSTLIDIFLGLLQANKGRIFVDGVDINAKLRAWQNLIGYVPQSIYLTDDSLRRNIAFGLHNNQIDENALLEAVKAAQLEEFLSELPDGLDTKVGERGVRLSGGQRQRIGIARALYHNPEVLVLDESTSSLDNDTELGVMLAIKALHGKKTIIIIAHRLSTVTHCDRIIRLNNGKIAQFLSGSEILNEIR